MNVGDRYRNFDHPSLLAYVHMHIYIYIYIYRERERERESNIRRKEQTITSEYMNADD